MEIDARSGTFQAFEMFGHNLLQKEHYASDDVKAKLDELAEARQNLEKLVDNFQHVFCA
jgi:spectrin alpha